MKIVDRAAFLAMPDGTVFAKYQPHVFDELAIKGETMGGDFVVQDLNPWFTTTTGDDYFDQLIAIQAGEPSPPLDYDCAGRDGLFDQDQLFAVFDRADLEALIDRLNVALMTYPAE